MGQEILVVDDEIDIRNLIADILQDEGYECRTAPDSDGASIYGLKGVIWTVSRYSNV